MGLGGPWTVDSSFPGAERARPASGGGDWRWGRLGAGQTFEGLVVVAQGLRCSAARGIFPKKRLNPCSLRWQTDSQPPGSPQRRFLRRKHKLSQCHYPPDSFVFTSELLSVPPSSSGLCSVSQAGASRRNKMPFLLGLDPGRGAHRWRDRSGLLQGPGCTRVGPIWRFKMSWKKRHLCSGFRSSRSLPGERDGNTFGKGMA